MYIVHVTQTRWGYVMFDTHEKANAFIDGHIENSEEANQLLLSWRLIPKLNLLQD